MSSNQIKQTKAIAKAIPKPISKKPILNRRGRISSLLAVLAVQRKIIKRNDEIIRRLLEIRKEREAELKKNIPSSGRHSEQK